MNKELILTDVEREYLKAFLKPFRDEVKFIQKVNIIYNEDDTEEHSFDTGLEYLYIDLSNDYDDYIRLPKFKKGTMYNGMELEEYYTLEELGIEYD